ncbi:MAG TPA: PQQ-dependent sugar dehydrogenase, partial [Acidimicrobiia bacterium]|nr:PQQ-dependent sugar dehydrogenase [Acidimicrobiia bacterium]
MPPGSVDDAPTLSPATFVPSLSIAWDLGFTPDGTILFTERASGISKVVDGTKVLVCAPPDLVVSGEAGMMGLVVDPNFASNRYVFTCFASNASGGADVRVVRWTVAADYSQLTNRADVVTGMPFTSGRHSGCRPRFGSDGFLWIGTGDSATGIVPVDLNSLGGKVLRVDRDGSPVAGNPFLGTVGDDRIYTYGHRNVQGLMFRAS